MKTIYLAGAITGLERDKANGWRKAIKKYLDGVNNWTVINPVSHIPDDKDITAEVERECMRWDLWKLKQSDIVICDFSHPDSVGTTWELAIAYELGIPIIGVMTDGIRAAHPWWKMSAQHICNNIDELYYYLIQHYLYD